jgi:hypothetical protein
MNLRGVKESVATIAPVFGVFVVTHALLLVVVLFGHAPELPKVASDVSSNVGETLSMLGVAGTLQLFFRAYSLGGGTYTGIEAVSNGVAIMREPRVDTAKRTMTLMAVSLAICASGLLVSYLLLDARPVEGKTMNAVLLELATGSWDIGGIHIGKGFVIVALLSEGALLFVAAQAGFVDGPRVMANLATDSWLPHRFSALSDRLTMRNGVVLMSVAAGAALAYTGGAVNKLVVMYAINVFLTFSLSNIAMCRFWVQNRREDPTWRRHIVPHALAALLCVTILIITIFEKFTEGGWLTLLITLGLAAFCFLVKRHYGLVVRAIRRLDSTLPGPEEGPEARAYYGIDELPHASAEIRSDEPVAILLVGGYGGLGRHALLTLLRMFPAHFESVVFVSVAVVDSDVFKGTRELQALEERTQQSLASYERFGAALGLKTNNSYAVGAEVAVEAEKLAVDLLAKYPKALVVAGQLVFEEDTVWNRLMHNETAFSIQTRLQHRGIPMIVLPVQLRLRGKGDEPPPSSFAWPPASRPSQTSRTSQTAQVS